MALPDTNQHYHAVVDMGSNGIRCSISDLSPSTSRILPAIYQERCNISLYNAQYQDGVKVPVPEAVIDDILVLLSNFRRTCTGFGVPDQQIQLVATEATRTAINSENFLNRIRDEAGLEARLLSQEEESKYGAMGIASSVNRDEFEGLILDMGGGSVQLTWMQKSVTGHVALKFFKSFPYGAAALMAQMSTRNSEDESKPLAEAVSEDLTSYFEELRAAVPEAFMGPPRKGLQIFASGGGFRSWGHILMSLDPVQPYPIPIVNSYVANGSRLIPDLTDHTPKKESHRISKRRGSQVPAIQFLVTAIVKALGVTQVSEVIFCQGGVREGLLFDGLSESVRSQNALTAATSPFAPKSSSELTEYLSSALPSIGSRHEWLIPAIVNMLYFHGSHNKDIRAAAALRSTTTGALASVHGISHSDRAILALALCERWGGKDDVPHCDREFLHSLETLEGARETWWARYLGRIAKGLAEIYPAGLVHECLVKISADWVAYMVRINIVPCSKSVVNITQHWAKELRHLGKCRNWAGKAKARYGNAIYTTIDLKNIQPA